MNIDLFREVPKMPPESFEPHCIERWAESVAGMDDMGTYADAPKQTRQPIESAS